MTHKDAVMICRIFENLAAEFDFEWEIEAAAEMFNETFGEFEMYATEDGGLDVGSWG